MHSKLVERLPYWINEKNCTAFVEILQVQIFVGVCINMQKMFIWNQSKRWMILRRNWLSLPYFACCSKSIWCLFSWHWGHCQDIALLLHHLCCLKRVIITFLWFCWHSEFFNSLAFTKPVGFLEQMQLREFSVYMRD